MLWVCPKFAGKGAVMATQVIAPRSDSFFEGAGFGEGLDQALQTSPEVLSAIYVAHYQHVLQVCRRFFRRPEDAEDTAAEVFLKLHLVLNKKDSEHPLRPWVCQVAQRHCIDKLRSRKRERCSVLARNDLCAVADSSTPSPLSQVLRKEAKRHVREELNRLPDYYKRPLVLRYYKRMSYCEIARALNRRVPAVKTIIFRAKSRLRRNLMPHWSHEEFMSARQGTTGASALCERGDLRLLQGASQFRYDTCSAFSDS
jgi:RNA polymerase sigma-70 factor, ECF subfamily